MNFPNDLKNDSINVEISKKRLSLLVIDLEKKKNNVPSETVNVSFNSM
jgi:hypothetical protein